MSLGFQINDPLSKEGGYPSERFVDNMDAHLCAICREVYRLPVSLNCGHTFCKKCLHKSELNFKNKCPSCRTTIYQSAPAFHLRMVIDGSPIHCVYQEYGCNHVDALSRMTDHELSCHLKHVPCNQCNIMCLESSLVQHKTDTCSRRPISCSDCTARVPFNEMKDHLEQCPLRKISCELCNESMARFILPRHHQDHCLKSIIPCIYNKYGCSFTCKREDMTHHEETTNHIPIICSTLDQKMEEFDKIIMTQLQNGPFRVAGHLHMVVLCSDLDQNNCHSCKKKINEKHGRYFGYHCMNDGCSYSICLSCFPDQRLFRSKHLKI